MSEGNDGGVLVRRWEEEGGVVEVSLLGLEGKGEDR